MAADLDETKLVQAHAGTYSFFTRLMKWATITAFVVAMIVILLISK